jgi:hypothetical protein
MNSWNDFNDANDQNSFALIPKGTVVRVRLTIRPGNFDDAAQGWTGGYATRNANTGTETRLWWRVLRSRFLRTWTSVLGPQC